MTTVLQVYSIRSFKSSKDRNFSKAIKIYHDNIDLRIKTESREISYWLDRGSRETNDKFYVCGLYIGKTLVGYVEFIYINAEELIHIDYFIIDPKYRTAGAFYIFTDQLKAFFDEERLEWSLITAEVAELDSKNEKLHHSKSLIRVFRRIGFLEVSTEYLQPSLGLGHTDTIISSHLLLFPRVEMDAISKERYLEIISAIYKKHYIVWYSMYPDTIAAYEKHVDELLNAAKRRLRNKKEIALLGAERDFTIAPPLPALNMRDAILYIIKVVVGMLATVCIHYLLSKKTEISTYGIIGIVLAVFALILVLISLTDKKRFEAFKLLVSLCGKFFDN
jgi:hypothetical protein